MALINVMCSATELGCQSTVIAEISVRVKVLYSSVQTADRAASLSAYVGLISAVQIINFRKL